MKEEDKFIDILYVGNYLVNNVRFLLEMCLWNSIDIRFFDFFFLGFSIDNIFFFFIIYLDLLLKLYIYYCFKIGKDFMNLNLYNRIF